MVSNFSQQKLLRTNMVTVSDGQLNFCGVIAFECVQYLHFKFPAKIDFTEGGHTYLT